MRRSDKTKSKSICRVLLTPSLLILLLFPLLACGIFYISASHYATKEAEGRLTELREQTLPVMDEMFGQEDADLSKGQVGRFVRQILPITRQIQGDTRLMIFVARKNYLVYPRDEAEQKLVQPEVEAFSAWIEEKYSEVQSTFTPAQSGAETAVTEQTGAAAALSEARSDTEAASFGKPGAQSTASAGRSDAAGATSPRLPTDVLKERNALKKAGSGAAVGAGEGAGDAGNDPDGGRGRVPREHLSDADFDEAGRVYHHLLSSGRHR